jgi:hypothetical protein
VIAKVVHGYRPAGLLRYLFGPGRVEEHENPRVVASWDGAPFLHQPGKLGSVNLDGERVEPGAFDFDLGPLTTTMQEVAQLAGLPLSNPPAISPEWEARVREDTVPPDAPVWLRHYQYDARTKAVVLRPGHVWHTPVRLHPGDPTLSDGQWEHIAQRLMEATGIHQAGCRWIAVRHADDHIHLMAVLVSENTGKPFTPFRDWVNLREECRRLEEESGLVRTAPIDRTAAPASTRAEMAKAERLGRSVTAREQLRRAVAQVAAGARRGAEFLADLRQEGLAPETMVDAAGVVCGYTVTLPGEVTANGESVRYPGGALAPDLTWPKLTMRWTSTDPVAEPARTEDGQVAPVERREALEHAARVVRRGESLVRDVRAGRDRQNAGEDVDGIVHAAGEVLSVLTRGREGHDPGALTAVADRFDRAARSPYRVVPQRVGPVGRELRMASRRMAKVGALSGRGKERFAAAALLLALAGLVAEIAAWQEARGRIHQAAAARAAAGDLPALARRSASPRPAGRPVPPSGGVSRERPMVRRDVAAPGEAQRPRGPGG